jgi:signal transduction histidine kinase
LFRIGQEATNNALKHGKPGRIKITLSVMGRVGRLEIADDGIGFPGERKGSTGMGLHIMSYRANMIGGSLEAETREGGGVTVTCVFPVRQSGEHA